ncbi:cytochrome-c peroxidase [Aliikangiella marina]|uniref:Cytochrome-c peroxidase n=1 Tax=Aliikangiella marina TaxID=1712262 RepID=A0A545TCM4_9GAMM|nr:cytochrome c peroxidase [Aliikangiella marina]TQV74972.1 cytochrome-c peroxidase [Aliikangiella marina]
MSIFPSKASLDNRLIGIISAAVIMSLSACGGSGDSNSPNTIDEEVIESPPVTETPPVENPPEDDNDPDEPTTTLVDGTIVNTAALVSLGEQLYNDTNLSTPAGQSCASCHSLSAGFADPNTQNPTSLGADGISFGGRNSPTASYAAHIPAPQIVMRTPPNGGNANAVRIGGLFWDGRAESLEEQAKGPFLNPVEMGNSDESEVIAKLRNAAYAGEFEALFGNNILDDVDRSYDYIADAIAAFERTDVFSPFSSKFDQVQNGTASFTAAEQRGENLFNGRAQCDRCHSSDADQPQMFSNFEYENIGVPSNPLLPAVMSDPSFVDNGLGDITGNNRDNGRFRTSSLRNVAITPPYMHNGVFNTLREVIDFYNTRDTSFNQLPEVAENVDQGGNIGELGLNENEINDLIAFLETLTDQ